MVSLQARPVKEDVAGKSKIDSLLDELLNLLEVRVLCIAHKLKQSHLQARCDSPANEHLLQAGAPIFLFARCDAVGQQVNLKSSVQKIV